MMHIFGLGLVVTGSVIFLLQQSIIPLYLALTGMSLLCVARLRFFSLDVFLSKHIQVYLMHGGPLGGYDNQTIYPLFLATEADSPILLSPLSSPRVWMPDAIVATGPPPDIAGLPGPLPRWVDPPTSFKRILRRIMGILFNYEERCPGSRHLENGRYTDPFGIYHLIQRRCGRVIACDATNDSLEGVIRRCRSEFGVEIDISLGAMMRDGRDLSQKHYELGTIR